jgi:hypothetical protein
LILLHPLKKIVFILPFTIQIFHIILIEAWKNETSLTKKLPFETYGNNNQ